MSRFLRAGQLRELQSEVLYHPSSGSFSNRADREALPCLWLTPFSVWAAALDTKCSKGGARLTCSQNLAL